MKALLLGCLGLALLGSACGQVTTPRPRVEPVRFIVRSADPWFIVAMMEGRPLVSPEMSTILGFMGMPQGATNAVNRLFDSGHLMVNPTDNSIWWIPERG